MRGLIVAFVALLGAGTARAETLRIESLIPARTDELAQLREIQIDSLGGDAGATMTFMVEDKLREVDLGQGPWFKVTPASLARGGGEAVLRGRAEMDFRRIDEVEQRERCIKDVNGKCTDQREKYVVDCIRREFALNTTLRLVGREGNLLWSDDGREPYSDKKCSDQSYQPRHPRDVERMLVGRVALRLQQDFAPRRELVDIRVDENRRGLTKEDGEAFKAAVRLVRDRRENEACAAWVTLGERLPDHLPTQFNIGLCAEFVGKADEARARYRQVLVANPGYSAAAAGLGRLEARARALRQLESRSAA